MKSIQKTRYCFKGITLQGQRIKGVLYTVDKNDAKRILTHRGITILSLHKKINLSHRSIPTKYIILFYQQLATLLDAGVPILQAFDLLQSTTNHQQLDPLIKAIRNDLASGKPLSVSLNGFNGYFDPMSCHLIYAGEQSGTLTIMLKRIAESHEKSLRFRKKIRQAMLYPSIILIVALSIASIMLLVIIPRFVDLFNQLHGTLPAFTQWVIHLSIIIRQYGVWILIAFCSIAGLLYYALQRSPYRRWFAIMSLKLPIINTLIQQSQWIRFSRNLATLFTAGIPIADCLDMTAQTASHLLYKTHILALKNNIIKGERLHQALHTNPLFPTLIVQMVKIGEESGNLEHMLEKIAALYESEFDHFIENLTQLLEPLIMVFLGVLIGGLVIAMYLPIFKQGTLI